MKRIHRFSAIFLIFQWISSMLAAQGSDLAAAESSLSTSGGSAWVVAVNLVIWTGIFLYLLSLHTKIRSLEKKS